MFWSKLKSLTRLPAKRMDPYVVTISISGRRYRIHIADRTAELWYAHDQSGENHPYPSEIRFLQEHGNLAPGSLVFDLGAHQSVIALFLAEIAGESGRVVSVEGSEWNVEIARKNRDLNAMANLEILHGAVGETTGTLDFISIENGRIGSSGAPGACRVDAWTVDDLARRHGVPDVVFMDIEGFEQRALEASPQVIAARPDFFVEVHARVGLEEFGGSVERVCACFPEDAYRRFFAVPAPDGGCDFLPLEGNRPPDSRFYLVALGRRPSGRPGGEGAASGG